MNMPKMIVSRGNLKRKRKGDRSLLLEESPKRVKVHAQRKFAQGSNVNSPVITPVLELEGAEGSGIMSLMPDPAELLPIKRPVTEDFLTFLCFRGTPLLPPSLNFFNTASIVDPDGQVRVHEIKSESPKNGPIDTSIIAKSGCGSTERPFIAFGVRKRADPIVISRQMDKKRRHALALQALRRKYQEQKMAKIRAVTISKLSEKVTNKTLVRTNSVSKSETVTKKSIVQKKVIATKHVKVTTRTVKTTTFRPKIQPKMCLRSFRGRFVQKELPFRNRNIKRNAAPIHKIIKKVEEKKVLIKKNRSMSSEFSSDDNEPLVTTTKKEVKRSPKVILPRVDKKPPQNSTDAPKLNNRVTRSGQMKNGKFEEKRQQIKKRIFLPATAPIVKMRNLRSHTIVKSTTASKPKTVVLINETLSPVKSGRPTRKFGAKVDPKTKKTVNLSDRVLRNPRQAKMQTSRRLIRRVQKVTTTSNTKTEKTKSHDKVQNEVSKSTIGNEEKSESISAKKVEKTQSVVNENKAPIQVKSDQKSSKKQDPKEVSLKDSLENAEKSQPVINENKAQIQVKSDQKSSKKQDPKEEVSPKDPIQKVPKTTEMSSKKAKITEPSTKGEGNPKELPKRRNAKASETQKAQTETQAAQTETQRAQTETRKAQTETHKAQTETQKTQTETKKGNETEKKKNEKSTVNENTRKGVKKLAKTKINTNGTSNEAKKEKNPPTKEEQTEDIQEPEITLKIKDEGKEKFQDEKVKKEVVPVRKEATVPIKKETAIPVKKETKEVKIEEKIIIEEKDNPDTSNSVKRVNKEKIENTKAPEKLVTKVEKRDIKGKAQPIKVSQNKKPDKKMNIKSVENEDTLIELKEELKCVTEKSKDVEQKPSNARPTRKTKEAAAIYMEILSHKLVNDSKIDDDNISIDSFPELPNVKRTQQRENEFRANSSKNVHKDNKDLLKTSKEPKSNKPENEIGIDEVPNASIKSKKCLAKKIQSDSNDKKELEEPQSELIKSKNIKQKELKVVVKTSNIDEKTVSKKISKYEQIKQNQKLKKKAPNKPNSEEIDEEKIKEEIMREVQEKFGTCVSLNTEDNLDESNSNLVKVSSQKRKSSTMSDEDEDLESIEALRKKLKSQASETNDNVTGKTVTIECEILPKEKPKSQEKSETKATKSEESQLQIKPIDTIESISEITDTVNEKNSQEKTSEEEKAVDTDKKTEKEFNEVNTDNQNIRKKTRSHNTISQDSNDSDESFHADVTVPKKKQVTRKRTPKLYKSLSDSEDDVLACNETESKKVLKVIPPEPVSSGESDHSTTSDVQNKRQGSSSKNKKYTKTKRKSKCDNNFSDSDEEPLSKLTSSKDQLKSDVDDLSNETGAKMVENKQTEGNSKKVLKPKTKDSKQNSSIQKPNNDNDQKVESTSTKPKRECAKRPQNYLPMFSSSDDEDKYFYGFSEDNKKETATSIPASLKNLVAQSTDLCSKDVGRRFGKGKVNMSNEQIEQWLKDSVMASSSSIKKENDEMLKFGEKIPTETTLELATPIDTQHLKISLLPVQEEKKEDIKSDVKPKQSAPKLLSPTSEKIKLSFTSKNQSLDKKLVFRKEKINTTPNVNAFSASNECSVYAFGEENEDVISTPFRRPVRRPSSTATSKSEDENRNDETTKIGHFRKPPLVKQDSKTSLKDNITEDARNISVAVQVSLETSDDNTNIESSCEAENSNTFESTNKNTEKTKANEEKLFYMVPPSSSYTAKSYKCTSRSFDRGSETSEDIKYKVPSSPSASSSSSAKLYKRQAAKSKARVSAEVCTPVNVPSFPISSSSAMLVEAPIFYPIDKEFQDPLEYIEKIRHKAEQFGICRIIPPSSFKPECKVTDDMRFTAYNQYIHKMLHRWGPNFKEFMAIKKYLQTQNITLTHSPWIGGMEIDLPRLYQTVQTLGGLKEVIEKKKWPKVSELMRIPKSAQDRVTKLDDIYCKYLLPYDTLSPAEREKLFDEVETEWAKRESKTLSKIQQGMISQSPSNESDAESDNEAEECIIKGRNMALNAFYRIARNTMSVWFKSPEPTAQEVEQEFWKHVTQRQNHICVHSGSIDSGSWGYGFAVTKNSPFARNGWNLKVLTNNSGSVLRCLGPIMGVTVPTLHVGMVFSACCWYRDPHSLPWIEYLHTGGNKIWYAIPDSASELFHTTLTKLVPNYCRNKTLWLTSDTAMIPPSLLIENGVSLCRTVQEPGQFVVVFPKAFTSSISTGYLVSESVYFAPPYWLKTAQKVFNNMRTCCEPSMFSLDRLLLSIANDSRSSVDVLRLILPLVGEMCNREKCQREKVKAIGLTATERLPLPEAPNARKRKKLQGEEGDFECEICRMNLFISMVTESQENGLYCMEHAMELIENGKVHLSNCKLLYTYDDDELDGLTDKINVAIENKLQKKIPNKYYGMPTLLKS